MASVRWKTVKKWKENTKKQAFVYNRMSVAKYGSLPD